MQTRDLGRGLVVSEQGLGCMGMSEFYGPADWDTSIATIHRALELGITLLDTADVYGRGHNEVLVGRAIAGRRDEVQIATKFGIDRFSASGHESMRGDAFYVRQCCDASLLRLGVDVIDLYYLHRAPDNVPIEETVAAVAELVQAGKVRHIGLSEASGELLRRAHAVHPITAMQSEYSILCRNVEFDAMDAMRELGVGLVPFSPIGHGLLSASVDMNALTAKDFRMIDPRFAGEAAAGYQPIIDAVREVAADHQVPPAQVALRWVYAQEERLGVPIVAIPGTKRVQWLEQNVAALEVELSADELARLDQLSALIPA